MIVFKYFIFIKGLNDFTRLDDFNDFTTVSRNPYGNMNMKIVFNYFALLKVDIISIKVLKDLRSENGNSRQLKRKCRQFGKLILY